MGEYSIALLLLLSFGCGQSSGSEDASFTDGTRVSDAGSEADGALSGGDADLPSPDASIEPGSVGMFLAQGHMGRTMLSCDDGQSWFANQSSDEGAQCFSNGLDCDHVSNSGTSAAFVDGHFLTSWGWGQSGALRRSGDGEVWSEIEPSFGTYSDLVSGNGVTFAASRPYRLSTDGGQSWGGPIDIDLQANGNEIWNIRSAIFSEYGTGRFIIAASDGDNETLMYSTDNAQTWNSAQYPAGCASSIQNFAEGSGYIVSVGFSGRVCYSSDGGLSWGITSLDIQPGVTQIESRVIWDGSSFHVFSMDGRRHSSVDGTVWTTSNLSPPIGLGPVVRDPLTGTYVGVRGGWNVWYEEQRFYRSSDGVSWTELGAGTYVGSHPITSIVYGRPNASVNCPTDTFTGN